MTIKNSTTFTFCGCFFVVRKCSNWKNSKRCVFYEKMTGRKRQTYRMISKKRFFKTKISKTSYFNFR
jgi:hypothetical protein